MIKEKTPTIETINKWYKKPIGEALLKSELSGLSRALSQIFGYYIVQIGGPAALNEMLISSNIRNHIIVNPDYIASENSSLPVQCKSDDLPFLPESIDATALFHILEFAQNPKSILREVYTTLRPNGYAIIFGFNPYSLWGIFSKKEATLHNNWISPGHMRHLLSEAGFSIGDYKTFYFRPPNTNPKKLLFLEGIGQIFWPYFGASYIFVAKKTVAGLTPIKPLLSLTKYFKHGKALPKPSSRVTECNKNEIL